MAQVTAAILRNGQIAGLPPLGARLPQHRDSEFIWISALDRVDSDFALLQERFGLVIHQEQRNMTFFALQVDKRGLKIRSGGCDCG